MTQFYWGMVAGGFIGVYLSFTLCALLATAKKADRQVEEKGNGG